jgi:hypothetical protein
MIQSGLIGFTAEDKLAQPVVQECPVFNFTKGAIFHMILDIKFISTSWLHSRLSCGTFEVPGVHES